jgi:hypothetical protein
VFLKKCDSCTIIFKVRADDASSRPVEEAWNEEVGCNYNKLAYTYISKDFKDEVKWSNAYVPHFLIWINFIASAWKLVQPGLGSLLAAISSNLFFVWLHWFLLIEWCDPFVFLIYIYLELSLSLVSLIFI